jgi:hypothetical protein
MAILVSDIDKRIHWLEAAARWLSLGREQGVLLPSKSQSRFPSLLRHERPGHPPQPVRRGLSLNRERSTRRGGLAF